MNLGDKLKCPGCATTLSGATRTGPVDYAPEVDDLSVCIYCQTLLVFIADGDGIGIRKLSADEFVELPVDLRSTLKAAQDAAASVMNDRASKAH
jgi:hypothetical protein